MLVATSWASYKKDKELENTDTPYGPLIKTMKAPKEVLPGAEPEDVLIKYTCPFGLLWITCRECSGFFDFIRRHACMSMEAFKASEYWDEAKPEAKPPARIVINEDEVRPGNIIRHDKGRAYLAVYWTFLDLPEWFTRSIKGWFTFTFVAETKMLQILGKDSQLTRLMLKAFFTNDGASVDFATTGCGLVDKAKPGAKPDSFWFTARFACFIGDADGHRKVAMCKGTSGVKVCACCINVRGRCDPEDIPADSACVHFTCGDLSKMQRLSPQGLRDLMAELRAKSLTMGKGEFKKLQQDYGWNWSEHSLVCSDMSLVANIPDSLYWDWMHTLCSSGGVVQYELNGILNRLKAVHKNLPKKLDEFKKFVVLPKSQQKVMKRLSFEDRMVAKPGKHIKAFAGEVLSMVEVFGLWLQLIVEPENVLVEETKCFLLMGRILFLLRSGDRVLSKLQLLQQLILEHHDLFVRLYPEEAKPKVHLLLHIPTLMKRFWKNLSCFVTERKHKQSKKLGAFCYNKMCDTMLRKSVEHHLVHFSDSQSLEAIRIFPARGLRLRGTRLAIQSWSQTLQQAGLLQANPPPVRAQPRAEPNLLVAHNANTPAGFLQETNLAVYCSGGFANAGFIRLFVQTKPGAQPGAQPETYAVVEQLKNLGGNRCSKNPLDTTICVVHASHLVGAFGYLPQGSELRILASSDIW